jgi:preprotein translocase subunit Sec61beta
MAKSNMRLPSSSAGITSFYNEYRSNLVLKPAHVVALVIFVIILEILLKSFI